MEHVFVIKMYSMLYISYTLIKCGEDGEKEEHLYTNVSMKWCNNLVNSWRSSCKSKCAYMPYSPATAFLKSSISQGRHHRNFGLNSFLCTLCRTV